MTNKKVERRRERERANFLKQESSNHDLKLSPREWLNGGQPVLCLCDCPGPGWSSFSNSLASSDIDVICNAMTSIVKSHQLLELNRTRVMGGGLKHSTTKRIRMVTLRPTRLMPSSLTSYVPAGRRRIQSLTYLYATSVHLIIYAFS